MMINQEMVTVMPIAYPELVSERVRRVKKALEKAAKSSLKRKLISFYRNSGGGAK